MTSLAHPFKELETKIYGIRGHRVMLDSDLAALYGVPTKRLNEQVRRNNERFPPDFVFPLTGQEVADLRSQFATSSLHGGTRYAPLAFTEQGIAMLSGVLRSPTAAQVNAAIMRAFVQMRQVLSSNGRLERKIRELESRYDDRFKAIFIAIRQLMTETTTPRKKIVGLAPRKKT